MKRITGHFVRLSPQRRMIYDMMHVSKQLPLIPGERRMHLADLVAARHAAKPRPSWLAMFIKAIANVSTRYPELRRVVVRYPWPRLYQFDQSIVSVIVEREHQGEPGLFVARFESPERMPLGEIDAQLRRFKTEPVDKIKRFRNALTISRKPLFLRRMLWHLAMNWMPRLRGKLIGTTGISLTAGMGGMALALVTPWTTSWFYDSPTDDGTLVFRGMFDHRVFDGMPMLRMSRDIEREMLGSILAEVRSMKPASPGDDVRAAA
jgi:hypothetical protein